jgi:hypothetical protein
LAVFFTNKTDRQDITEMLLKVALNTITPIPSFVSWKRQFFQIILIINGANEINAEE